MKKYILLLVMALAVLCVQAQSYKYLNFTDTVGDIQQVSTTDLKITFADGNALVSTNGEQKTISLSALDYLEFTNTKVYAGEYVRGDMHGNGIVDVSDVNAVINIILKLNEPSDYLGNGDLDESGIIDVSDVNIMINIILKLI